MRFLVIVALWLALPATAQAATAAVEGSELVYRAGAGERIFVVVTEVEGQLQLEDHEVQITAGAGCAAERRQARCALAGLTAVRIVGGAGDDNVAFILGVPVFADLGAGDDEFEGRASAVTVSAGAGDDRVAMTGGTGAVDLGPGTDRADLDIVGTFVGPFAIEGGDGPDRIAVIGRGPGIALSGGSGNDRLTVLGPETGAPVDVACGPGADETRLAPIDRPGDGCAAHLTGITPRTVSRAFREGTLTAPASGSVTFRRRVAKQVNPRETIARGTFTARAGALRVSLRPTRAGRRWLARNPRLPVHVYVRTRSGADRGEIVFASRIR